MERHRIDEAGAFGMLREQSPVDNRKLVDRHRLLPESPMPISVLTSRSARASARLIPSVLSSV
jgi:hypothetical protein